ERLMAGPMLIAEAAIVARQIADALEAAHDRGIVHRDLKPADVILQGVWEGPSKGASPAMVNDVRVKVVDFGLAKIGGERPGDPTHSPTLTIGATSEGVILGTAAYMSPEQARGKVVDKRTDVWAFGCVL